MTSQASAGGDQRRHDQRRRLGRPQRGAGGPDPGRRTSCGHRRIRPTHRIDSATAPGTGLGRPRPRRRARQVGPGHQRLDVGRHGGRSAAGRRPSRGPGSCAYGWMSSHGRRTNARRWARGCGSVSSGSSLTTGVPSSRPHRDHVHIQGTGAEPALAGRAPARPPRSSAAGPVQPVPRRPVPSATRTTALRYAGWSASPHGGVS